MQEAFVGLCVNIAWQNFRNINHKSLFICRHSFAMGMGSLKLVRTCKTCAENVWTFDS